MKQEALYSDTHGHVMPAKQERFVVYEQNDVGYLEYAGNLRKALRGEGRTKCDISRAVSTLESGKNVDFHAVTRNHSRVRSMIAQEIERRGIELTENNRLSVRTKQGATPRLRPPVKAEDCFGSPRLHISDHYVRESRPYRHIELPREYQLANQPGRNDSSGPHTP